MPQYRVTKHYNITLSEIVEASDKTAALDATDSADAVYYLGGDVVELSATAEEVFPVQSIARFASGLQLDEENG